MMDVLSELQGYYSIAGTINMDERKIRFQKLSYEAQEFATDFESLIRQKVSLENIIEKLGKKFSKKGITSLYYTYLKMAGTVEDALVIDAVFEQKTEYLVKMLERERLRNQFRKMAKKEESQIANRMLANMEVKESRMPSIPPPQKKLAPEVTGFEVKSKKAWVNFVIFIVIILLILTILNFIVSKLF